MVEEFFRMASSNSYHELGGPPRDAPWVNQGIRQKMEKRIPLLKARSAPAGDAEEKHKVTTTLTVRCRVCAHPVAVAQRWMHLVQCPNCGEATAVRGAPQGRKFVRCQCNCLLICKDTSTRIGCPRCKRVLGVDGGSPQAPLLPRLPNMKRVICVHCCDIFLFNIQTSPFARCPHCRKVSSVSPEFNQRRGLKLLGVGCLALILSIIVTAATMHQANDGKVGFYVVYILLLIASAVLIYRGVHFVRMKSSQISASV